MKVITKNTSTERQENTPQNTIVGGVGIVIQAFPSETMNHLPEQRENMGVLLDELQEVVEKRRKEIGYDYNHKDYIDRLCQNDKLFEKTLKQVLSIPQIGELYSQVIEAFPGDLRGIAEQRIMKEYLEDLVFESIKVKKLELSITRVQLKEQGIYKEEIAQGYLRQIEELKGGRVKNLDFQNYELGFHLGIDGMMKFLRALEGSGVEGLSIGSNGLGEYLGMRGMVAFVKALKGSGVKYLNLRWNELGKYLGTDGMVELARALKGSGVKYLDLRWNELGRYLGADGMVKFVEALRGSGVRFLNLGENKLGRYLGADGMVELAKALKGSGIRVLSLGENELGKYLGTDGMVKFAKELKGSEVKILSLGENKLLKHLGIDGIVKSVKALRGSGVKRLYLDTNDLSNEDAEILKTQFPDMHFIF